MEAGIDTDAPEPSEIIITILAAGVAAIQRHGLVGVDEDAVNELVNVLELAGTEHVDINGLLATIGKKPVSHPASREDSVGRPADRSEDTELAVLKKGGITARLTEWDPVFCTATVDTDRPLTVPCKMEDGGLLLQAGQGDDIVKITSIRVSINSEGTIDDAFCTANTNSGIHETVLKAVHDGRLEAAPDWKYSRVEWDWVDSPTRPTMQAFLSQYGVRSLLDKYDHNVISEDILSMPAIARDPAGTAIVEDIVEDGKDVKR
jgi:hypothetical protein